MSERTPLFRRGATRWALLGILVAVALIIVLPAAMRRQPALAQAENGTPFEVTVSVNVATSRTSGASVIPVPSGRRAFIRRVSVRGVVPTGATWAFSLGVNDSSGLPAVHFLPFPEFQANTVGKLQLNLVENAVDGIFADPLTIRCNAERNVAGAAATINFTVSGFLVNP